MPRGPGKSSNYNLDYSRFNSLENDDDDAKERRKETPLPEVSSNDGDSGDADFTAMLRNMPPELQEAYRLMAISRETGDEKAKERANELALKAVEKGGPEVRKTFLREVSKRAPEVLPADALGGLDGLDGLEEEPEPANSADALGNRIDRMKAQMEAGREVTRKQLESLEKQQEQLMSLSSPEDFMKFMQKEGMSNEDLQRMLTGDQSHMEAMVGKMLDKAADTGGEAKLKNADSAIKKAEELHARVMGVDAPDGAREEAAPKKEVPAPKVIRETPKPEEEVTIPNHRLQYQKDAEGRFTAVELICTLPGVGDMGCIALDVAEKHLRLNTVAPAPRYAVNAGPFPVLIEPSAAKAKFSKKRQELSVVVQAKADR
eukprot:TRINITY_DN7904_c0_g1_i1.p1 TRINITY_DN7904_c0_g1~~TRINITY_DN7904_c0_g1_i1.p1  ORF type:complete len:383 (+),score=112.62 TRINITY_DN7904_c0_g1_i1:30-1151(+)